MPLLQGQSALSAKPAGTRAVLAPLESPHCIKGMVPVPKTEWPRLHRTLRSLLPLDLSLGIKLVDVRSRYLACYHGWRGYGFKLDGGDKTRILLAMISDQGEALPLDGTDTAIATANQYMRIALSRRDVLPYATHYFRSVARNHDYSSPCGGLGEWEGADILPLREQQRLEKMTFGLHFMGEEFGAWRLQGAFAGAKALYWRDFLVDARGEIFMLGEEIIAAARHETAREKKLADEVAEGL